MIGGTSATYAHALENSKDSVKTGIVLNMGKVPMIIAPALVKLDESLSKPSSLRSLEIQRVLSDIAHIPKTKLPAFWDKLPMKFKKHKFICAAWTTKGSIEDDTFNRYLNAVQEMVSFWRKNSFCTRQSTLFEALSSIDQTLAFSNFLIAKCAKAKKLAGGTITRFKYSLIKLLNFYGIPLNLDRELTKNVIKTCCQFWGTEAKPTAAIPRKVLRQLFEYLRETDNHLFTFIAFVFFTAMRVSEALKLSSHDFKFFQSSEGRPSVSIHLRNTKTRKRYSDSGHTIIFTKLNVQTDLDPYILAQKLFEFAKASKNDTIVPFPGTLGTRTKGLYSWFRQMKSDFHNWNLEKNSVNYDTSPWRFHSLRTTFVGIMRQLGMSWEQLQLRTGHAWDSACTKDTYFMNALMSQEFDQTFEKMLTQNLQAQKLFVLTGGTGPELQRLREHTAQFRTQFESVLSEELKPQELFTLTGGVDDENLTPQDQEIFLQKENFEATYDNPFLTTVQQWSDSSSLRKEKRTKRKRGLSLCTQKTFPLLQKTQQVNKKIRQTPSFLNTKSPQRPSASVGPMFQEPVRRLTLSSDRHLPKKASASLCSQISGTSSDLSPKTQELTELEALFSENYNPFLLPNRFTPVKQCFEPSETSLSPLKYKKQQKASTPAPTRRRSASLSCHLDNKILLQVPDITGILNKPKKPKQQDGIEIYHPTRNSIKRAENLFLRDFQSQTRSRSFSPSTFRPRKKPRTVLEKKPKTRKKL